MKPKENSAKTDRHRENVKKYALVILLTFPLLALYLKFDTPKVSASIIETIQNGMTNFNQSVGNATGGGNSATGASNSGVGKVSCFEQTGLPISDSELAPNKTPSATPADGVKATVGAVRTIGEGVAARLNQAGPGIEALGIVAFGSRPASTAIAMGLPLTNKTLATTQVSTIGNFASHSISNEAIKVDDSKPILPHSYYSIMESPKVLAVAVISDTTTISEQMSLLLGVVTEIGKEIKTLGGTAPNKTEFFQGTQIISTSLDNLSSMFRAQPTSANRNLIQSSITALTASLKETQIAQTDVNRALAVSDLVIRGGNLLSQIAQVPIRPSSEEIESLRLFNENGATFNQSMQNIYDLTNDTGSGMPLENAAVLAEIIKIVSDEYSVALQTASATGNYNSPAFLEAARRMKVLTDNLTTLSNRNVSDDVATGATNNLINGGIISSNQGPSALSGMQAINTIAQMSGSGGGTQSFTNINRAIQQSGMLSSGAGAQMGNALQAFEQIQKIFSGKGGAMGILQGVKQLSGMFSGGSSSIGRAVSNMGSGAGGGGLGAGGGNTPPLNPSPEEVNGQRIAARDLSDSAGGVKEDADDAGDKAAEAPAAGEGTPEAVDKKGAEKEGGAGTGGTSKKTPIADNLGGSEIGVPVNVKKGTPYFNIVKSIREISSQACDYLADIDLIQQLTWDKIHVQDPKTVNEVAEATKKAAEEWEKTMADKRKLPDGNKGSFRPTYEQFEKENVTVADAAAYDRAKKAFEKNAFKDELQKKLEAEMKKSADKDVSFESVLKIAKEKPKEGKDQKTANDFIQAHSPYFDPTILYGKAIEMVKDTRTKRIEDAQATYQGNLTVPPQTKCEGAGRKVKNAQGKEICIHPEIDGPAGAVLALTDYRWRTSPIEQADSTTGTSQRDHKERVAEAPKEQLPDSGMQDGGDDRDQDGNPGGDNDDGGGNDDDGDGGGDDGGDDGGGGGGNGGGGEDWLKKLLEIYCRANPTSRICGGNGGGGGGDNPPAEVKPVLALSSTKTTVNGLPAVSLTWAVNGARSCRTDNAWVSYGKGASASLTKENLVTSGSSLPPKCGSGNGTCSQTVYEPAVFKVAVSITSPSGVPRADQSRSFETSLTMEPTLNQSSGSTVYQTTSFRPNLSGVVAGDSVVLTVNGSTLRGVIPAGTVSASLVTDLIRDAKSLLTPTSPEYETFNSLTLSSLNEILTISGSTRSTATIPANTEYKMSCENNAGETKDSTVSTIATP
ncbi:MAG: hypothetical protein HZA95_03500 [Candidatus Vogelbacteria bacterium]|nr:hypothetical protein [Candidatus Vogelbacteria bacterium]